MGLAVILTLGYMPWNRCFYSDAEPQKSYCHFAGYSFVFTPPVPETLNHPAYYVEPAMDKTALEWLIIVCTLQIAGCLMWAIRQRVCGLKPIPFKVPSGK